jgi:hypothetical protein
MFLEGFLACIGKLLLLLWLRVEPEHSLFVRMSCYGSPSGCYAERVLIS